MEELSKLERLISIRIIQEDAEAICSLVESERDPIFAMEIIPYFALFVQSCQEYVGDNFLPEKVALTIKDIRNHIKKNSESFGRTKKRILSIDEEQDSDFKSQLRYDFLKDWNIHLNLGTYWTEDGHIVGNTQQLADFLGIRTLFNPERGKKQYELGYQIGSFVASVREGLGNALSRPTINRQTKSVMIKNYYDINTNKQNALFVDNESKELNLFFLHLLCNMNFTKFVLIPLFSRGNTWTFRIEYVVTYYTFCALKRLVNYCENNTDIAIDVKEVGKILNEGKDLFQSKLRNCMMHYNLENQGVLSFRYIEKPFFGIVENCFGGMDYQTYLCSLNRLSDMIIAYIEKRFNFSHIKLERL